MENGHHFPSVCARSPEIFRTGEVDPYSFAKDVDQAAATLRQTRLRSKDQFERLYKKRLITYVFKPGDLVLVWNSQIERELDKKSKLRYLGPYQIVRRTKAGSYVIQELDGAISRRGIARFRLIPYIPREGRELQEMALEKEEDEEDDDIRS